MHPRHHYPSIGRTTAFIFRLVQPEQGDQTLPWHHLNHLDQEQFFADLPALAGVLGVGEGHLLHRKNRRVESGYFAKTKKSCSEFPYVVIPAYAGMTTYFRAARKYWVIARPDNDIRAG